MRRCKLNKCTVPLLLAGLPAQISHGDPLAFDIGPILVRPRADVSETYNDNVLYHQTDVKGDFITTISPGVGLSLGTFDVNHIFVNYMMPANIYASQTTLNGINHNVSFDGLYEGPKTTVQATEAYTSNFGLLGGSTMLDAPVGWETYNDSIRVGYDVAGKTSLYAKADYTAQEFERGFGFIDYADIRGTLGASYHYSPKTSFFLEAYYGHLKTHSELDSIPSGPRARYYGAFAGVNGELATRFTWYAKAGYELRDYSDGTSAPGALVAEIDLAYNMNDRTKIDLRYRRANQSSINYSGQNYVLDSVTAALTQKFGSSEKLEARLAIDYSSYAYTLGTLNNRTDDALLAGLDVIYHFNDWLTGDCGYQFLNFGTTDPTVRTYQVNKFFVLLNIGYLKVTR